MPRRMKAMCGAEVEAAVSGDPGVHSRVSRVSTRVDHRAAVRAPAEDGADAAHGEQDLSRDVPPLRR